MGKVYNNDEFYKGRIYALADLPLGVDETWAPGQLGLEDKKEYFFKLVEEMERDGLLAVDPARPIKIWKAV